VRNNAKAELKSEFDALEQRRLEILKPKVAENTTQPEAAQETNQEQSQTETTTTNEGTQGENIVANENNGAGTDKVGEMGASGSKPPVCLLNKTYSPP
jgi:uncharacterized low-complexity protein